MKNLKMDKTTKKVKKTKTEIKKQLEESIIDNENVTTDIEESAGKIQNSEEAAAVVQKMEKIIKSNKCNILWLAYQQGKIFEKLKGNDKFVNLVNKFGIRKSTMVFKNAIVRFLNNYPRMEKSPLSLLLLRNNFKTIKDICSENASELKKLKICLKVTSIFLTYF